MIPDAKSLDLFGDDEVTLVPDMFDGAPPLDKLRHMFREAYDSATEARDSAAADCAYFHGQKQLSPIIRAEMARRKQPPLYNNMIRPAVNGVLGLLDSGETTPEAIGRDESDDEAATIVTKILRFFAEQTDLDDVKRGASFDLLVNGVCAAIVEATEDGDARVSAIRYGEFFCDPFSLEHDFRDARYMGRAKWVDVTVAKRMFPEAYGLLGNPLSGGFDGDGPEDQPEFRGIWIDPGRRRILIVELYYQDDQSGEWMHATYCHAGMLDFGPSPYVDDEGMAVCPITALSFEVEPDGSRYGMVRDMRPLQDSINARMSKMLHVTNTAQVQAGEGSNPTDAKTAREEAAKPDGVMPMGYSKIPQTDVFQGNHILLQNDMQALERMAPSPALLGRAGGANESGRARQVLQQAGMSELARAFGRWEKWELRLYRQMWFRAQQYMTDARRIRITNDIGAPESLHVNVPIVDHRPMPVIDPATSQPAIDPMTGQPQVEMQPVQVGKQNELAAMDMDITIKTVRQVDTLRMEAYEMALEYAAKAGVSPLAPEFEMVIEMSPIPDKAALLAKYNAIKSKAQQEQQAAQQAQQQAQAITAAATESKVARDNAQAERDHALAEKHGIEAQSSAFDLALKRTLTEHGIHPDSPPAY